MKLLACTQLCVLIFLITSISISYEQWKTFEYFDLNLEKACFEISVGFTTWYVKHSSFGGLFSSASNLQIVVLILVLH
jgi:hypothetical protein